MGGLEIGQQTLRFSGIRYIQGALQSGPILLVMSVLMLDLDNNPDPGRAENKLLGQLGGPLLVLTYTFAAINVLIILAADLKPKKTRVSRLKPVDTCGVSIKERSTVLVVSACEIVSSTFLFALLIHVQGAQHAALYMLAFYALLVFGWRWWTRRIKDRKGVFLFALVFSIPNMLGSFFTAGMCACAHAQRMRSHVLGASGDAETSFIYQFRGPLRMTETEFLRSGVWMPDFLALHVLRMGGMVALILLSLRTTFSEALMPSAASDGGALAWQNAFAISVVACLCALNAVIALHFELKRRGVLAWGRAAQSRMLHRARMDEKKRRHRERFDAKLGSSSEEDADPEERARRARVKRRALLRRLRSKPCIVRCPILCLYRATDVLSDCLACGCCIRARERQRKRRDKERKKREKAARRARRRGEGSATAVGPRQAWCWRLCCCGRCSRNTVASEAYSVDDASDATSRRSSKVSARSAGSKRSSSSRASRAHPPAKRFGSSGRVPSRGSSRAHSIGSHRGASERGKPPSDGSAAYVVTVAPSNPTTAGPGTNHSHANSAEDTKLSPTAQFGPR